MKIIEFNASAFNNIEFECVNPMVQSLFSDPQRSKI